MTNRRDALEAAWRGYTTTLRTIGGGGTDTMWAAKGASQLYYANMTWGPLSVTAHALERSGVPDAHRLATGGGRLHEAAEWLVVSMRARSDPLLDNARGLGSRSVAWLELLFADQPGAAAFAPEARRALDRLGSPVYVAFAGGPVSCLYRRLP